MTKTESKIRQLIAQVLDIHITAVTPSAHLKELGADALDYLEMLIQFGQHFRGEICEKEAQQIRTVADIIACYGKLQPVYVQA